MRTIPYALVAVLSIAGCPGGDEGNGMSTGPSSSAKYAPTAEPAQASAAPRASAAPASPYAGTWSGTFKSARAVIQLPDGVPYPSWESDPGGHEGDNAIELTIDEAGIVKGKITGALGTLRVSGLAEDQALSAGISPEAGETAGMSGVLSGTIEAKSAAATLRVASADAKLVRGGEMTLARR